MAIGIVSGVPRLTPGLGARSNCASIVSGCSPSSVSDEHGRALVVDQVEASGMPLSRGVPGHLDEGDEGERRQARAGDRPAPADDVELALRGLRIVREHEGDLRLAQHGRQLLTPETTSGRPEGRPLRFAGCYVSLRRGW